MVPYVSHPVRRIREDPIEGESVALRVTAADEDARGAVADAIADLGTVDERLRFDGLRVTVPQESVGAVCEVPGVAAVETANTLAIDPDGAGEDVDSGT